MELKNKSKFILKLLKKEYPDAHCELTYSNPFELLIATILSAQCTDVQVNKVTPKLFAKYPDASKLSQADLKDVEEIIHSTGFYKSKAKNIIECSKTMTDEYQGKVPQTMEELTKLSGVGRKTANVVLGNAFNINLGIVVDTHVKRISNLLGLTKNNDPIKVEQDLMKLFNKKNWCELSHLLIFHGRRVCVARKPKCSQCKLEEYCPNSKK